MAGMGPGHDLARELAAVVIEDHIDKLRADPRCLSRRARASTSEYRADIGETRCPERRPAQQPRTEDAERDGYRKLALGAGEGGDRERHNAAADLDRAGKHDRIGRTKHLQQRVKKNDGDDAGDQGRHVPNIGSSAAKSMTLSHPQKGLPKPKASLALAMGTY